MVLAVGFGVTGLGGIDAVKDRELYTLGVGLADNENYQKLIPASMRDKIDEISKMIVSGEIKVGTAFGQ